MSGETPHRKHSVTLPTETSEAITPRVGKREFSAYVARAAARQLERDALDDVLAEMEAKHGPVDQAQVEAIANRLSPTKSAMRPATCAYVAGPCDRADQ